MSDRDIVEVVRTEYVYTRPPPWSDTLPTIHVVTPTYSRPVQKAELTRLANTLLHVPNLHWLVVEDAPRRTPLTARLLRDTGLNYTHLHVETPRNYKLRGDARDPRIPRGTMQRNLALRWLREAFPRNSSQPGVVYFADDDNTYSLELFEEVWAPGTRRPGRAGNLAKGEEACVGLPDRPTHCSPAFRALFGGGLPVAEGSRVPHPPSVSPQLPPPECGIRAVGEGRNLGDRALAAKAGAQVTCQGEHPLPAGWPCSQPWPVLRRRLPWAARLPDSSPLQMRSTRRVSVWPVAFVGGLRYEAPRVNGAGKVVGWKTVFDPHRPFAIDMAGFAVNLRLILQRSQAYFKLRGVKGGYQESSLLRELVTLSDLEPKAANCTKVGPRRARSTVARCRPAPAREAPC